MIAAALVLASLSADLTPQDIQRYYAGAVMNEALNRAVTCIVDHVPYPSWDLVRDIPEATKSCVTEVQYAITVRESLLGGGSRAAEWYIENTLVPMVTNRVYMRQRMR